MRVGERCGLCEGWFFFLVVCGGGLVALSHAKKTTARVNFPYTIFTLNRSLDVLKTMSSTKRYKVH